MYGAARTLLALGSAGTLLFTPSALLFSRIHGSSADPLCAGWARAGLFCLAPERHLALFQWLALALLGLVAIG